MYYCSASDVAELLLSMEVDQNQGLASVCTAASGCCHIIIVSCFLHPGMEDDPKTVFSVSLFQISWNKLCQDFCSHGCRITESTYS